MPGRCGGDFGFRAPQRVFGNQEGFGLRAGPLWMELSQGGTVNPTSGNVGRGHGSRNRGVRLGRAKAQARGGG